MCQAGNLYRHCNVKVDTNYHSLGISLKDKFAGAVLTSDTLLDLDYKAASCFII